MSESDESMTEQGVINMSLGAKGNKPFESILTQNILKKNKRTCLWKEKKKYSWAKLFKIKIMECQHVYFCNMCDEGYYHLEELTEPRA